MSQDNIDLPTQQTRCDGAAGLPRDPRQIHAHQLRHARAMQMLRAGVPLPHIKEFLGHANIATTNIYASADNQMVRDAIQKAAATHPNSPPSGKETTT